MTDAAMGANANAPATALGNAANAVTAFYQKLAVAWSRATTVQRATTLLLASLVGLGVILRVWDIADPPLFTFDEEFFARNAGHYLVRNADVNDHPPLGKLLIAIGFLLYDYDSLGWRFIPLCFGLYTVVVAYWLGSRLFESRRTGLIVAAFFAGDGFFIAYSRSGLMDGILTCFILWGVLAAVIATRKRQVLASVLLCSLAMTVKWSGAMTVVPAAAAVWAMGRVPRWTVLLFGLTPILHALFWMGALALTGQPWDPASWWKLAHDLFLHHVELGSHDNGLASPWYSWIYLYHPIVVKLSYHGLGQRYASSAGNPLNWAAASLLVVGMPLFALFVVVKRLFRKKTTPAVPLDPFIVRALVLSLGWFALLLPWMLGRGKFTFSYHYLPSYAFALVLVGAVIGRLERRLPAVALGFVTLVTAISFYFAPVWGEKTLSDAAANRRLVFPLWRP